MKVIVVGCGRYGSELAYRLYQSGHTVSIIDENEEAFKILMPDFMGTLHEGDVLNKDVLHRAGIEEADALAAVTDNDSLNMVVGHIASKVYKIQRVVVRNYNPQYRSMFEDFGLQVVSSTSWGAQRLEEMIFHETSRTVFSAGNGEVELYELVVPDKWVGKTLGDLYPCEGSILAALTRSGRAHLPAPDIRIEAGDVILVSATFEGIDAMRKQICADEEA
jgi:trk system potassium uptake protein